MRQCALSAAAVALLLAGCGEQAASEDDAAAIRPLMDAALAPVSAGALPEAGTSSPDASSSSGRAGGNAGGLTGGGGSVGASFDSGPTAGNSAGPARDAGAAEAGLGSSDGGASTDGAVSTGDAGSCEKGRTKGSEVVVIGDSFIAINHAITTQVQNKARAAGALGQADKYRDLAVSGTTLANNQIPGQYTRAVAAGPVKVVLMNGGGNDCLQRNDAAGALTAATSLLESMGQNSTEYVVYFFYPDPAGLLGGGSLKSCLDTLRPQIKTLCDRLGKPKCLFVDLRSTWKTSYAMADGIHPTQEGGAAVGDVVWQTMQEHCIAQ